MECTYWKSNTSRYVEKGLAFRIKGSTMRLLKVNLIVFIMIGIITNLRSNSKLYLLI